MAALWARQKEEDGHERLVFGLLSYYPSFFPSLVGSSVFRSNSDTRISASMLLLSLSSAPLLDLSSSSSFLRATGRGLTFLPGPLKSRKNTSNNGTSLAPKELRMRRVGGRWWEPSSPSRLNCRAQLYDQLAPTASAVYGTLLLGGGLFAYVRSGSKGSIIGGAVGAILMATTYFLMQAPETKNIGDALGFGSAFLFSAVFGIRLAATRKLIPAGLLLGLSVCALAIFLSAYMHNNYVINDPAIM